MQIVIIAGLAVIAIVLVFLFIKSRNELSQKSTEIINLTKRFQGIIDVEKVIEEKKVEIQNLQTSIGNLEGEYLKKNEELNNNYTNKRNVFQVLIKEISILEENLENISYGLYKPHFNYNTSDEYKKELEAIWSAEKDLIKNGNATYCPTEWTVGGSKVEGKKMVKQGSKLMLRAFNGECDGAISKVSWNNIVNMEARIIKSFESINKLGTTNNISITSEYFNLKLKELRLEFELEEKIYQEKEEQRRIREQMREEEKVQKEIEKAQRDATEEEGRYQKALLQAQKDIQNVTGSKLEELNNKIKELENGLKLAQENKQRAISRAQLTKSGHIYIISNIGSFGENIFKIGMTRRLEPLDRIKELGDASVPFGFDIHALIYSDNAPELENILHKKFHTNRMNMINIKREFFSTTLEEIENVLKELKFEIEIIKLAEAKEYRSTISLRNTVIKDIDQTVSIEVDKFPVSLN